MNRAFEGSSGQGDSRSPSGSPPEGPATDWTTTGSRGSTASSRGDTGGSTATTASSSDGMSTTSSAQNPARRPNSILAALPSGAFNGKGRSCGPPPGEIGSSSSLISSAVTSGGGAVRVTSDATPGISTRITANTAAATAALSAVDPGDTTLGREGFATATCCRVGLQTSCIGVRATLNPSIPCPLTESERESPSKKAQSAEYQKEKHIGWRAARL
ncbi:uncharacterized protein [Miscanthus floridulus]|uniref:uncharacterized protein n=1 Tax=Miscanthus floridulus TaxID=154761 RepID=UPI003457F8FB